MPGLGGLFSDGIARVWEWMPRDWFAAYLGWTPERMKPLIYPLWFLRDLMLMNLLAPLIRRAVERFPGAFLCVLAALLTWETDDAFFRCTVQEVFVFFCLGCYAARYDLHFSDLDRVPRGCAAALYLLAALCACLQREHYATSGALRALSNLAGVLFFGRCCTRVPEGKWRARLLRLSEYGIAIYFFHERLLGFMKKLALRLLPVCLPTTLAIFYLLPMLNVALCVLAAWLLRRFLPRTYRLLTGGR